MKACILRKGTNILRIKYYNGKFKGAPLSQLCDFPDDLSWCFPLDPREYLIDLSKSDLWSTTAAIKRTLIGD